MILNDDSSEYLSYLKYLLFFEYILNCYKMKYQKIIILNYRLLCQLVGIYVLTEKTSII